MDQVPTIGRIVHYRSRTGKYDVAAIVTATVNQLNPEGVEAGAVPPLSGPDYVHLQVLSPGTPGMRYGAQDFLVESEYPVQENVNGTYQEWDIPFTSVEASADIGSAGWDDVPPGTWRWPARV